MVHFVTAKELRQCLKPSEAIIYKLVGSGELPDFKIGDSWGFDTDETIKLIKGTRNENDE
jgi:hypothetical protein